MKAYRGVDILIYVYMSSALDGGEECRLLGGGWLVSHPDCFAYGERFPGTQWIRFWVGPTAGLEFMKK
jgi:hypothetical protein